MRREDYFQDQEENNAPMIEIFGGVFALLLVLFVIINLFSEARLQERLDQSRDEGSYKVDWGGSGAGYVVITYPDHLYIIEHGEKVDRENLCKADSAFVRYARGIYRREREQIIFTILEGGTGTMADARNCLMQIMPGQKLAIGWIIADNELLKSASLGDIPAHIQKVLEP